MSFKTAKEIIQLFRGSLDYRMATFLVRIGVAVLAAPPLILIILILSLGLTAEELGRPFEEEPWYLQPILGVSLIILGYVTFLRARTATPKPIPDQFHFTVPDSDWNFADTAKKIAGSAGKLLNIDNFSDQAKQQILIPNRIEASDHIEALKELRNIATHSGVIPEYDIIKDGAQIIIRAKDIDHAKH